MTLHVLIDLLRWLILDKIKAEDRNYSFVQCWLLYHNNGIEMEEDRAKIAKVSRMTCNLPWLNLHERSDFSWGRALRRIEQEWSRSLIGSSWDITKTFEDQWTHCCASFYAFIHSIVTMQLQHYKQYDENTSWTSHPSLNYSSMRVASFPITLPSTRGVN
jgi:hypothetical protein